MGQGKRWVRRGEEHGKCKTDVESPPLPILNFCWGHEVGRVVHFRRSLVHVHGEGRFRLGGSITAGITVPFLQQYLTLPIVVSFVLFRGRSEITGLIEIIVHVRASLVVFSS